MEETQQFHKRSHTFVCSKTKQCVINGEYIATDIVSPLALAHISKFMSNTTVGCDAYKWTSLYPPPLMIERFLKKCRAMNTRIKIYNYEIVRPDLDALFGAHADIIEHCGHI